jgi:hypothetical protein
MMSLPCGAGVLARVAEHGRSAAIALSVVARGLGCHPAAANTAKCTAGAGLADLAVLET